MLSVGVFSRQSRKVRVILILADLVLVWLALEAAYHARSVMPLRLFFLEDRVKALVLLFAMLSWVLSGFWLRVYERIITTNYWRCFSLSFRQSVVAATAVILFQYSQRLDLSRPFLAMFALFATLFLAAFRLVFLMLAPHVSRGLLQPRYAYIVGSGPSAERVAGLLEGSSDYGLRLSGFLDRQQGTFTTTRGTYIVHSSCDFPSLLQRQIVDEVIFAVDTGRLSEWEDVMLMCDEEGIRARLTVDFFPHGNSRVYLDRLSGLPLLTFAAAPHDEFRLLLKRAGDVIVSMLGLIVLAPLMAMVAVAIRATSPGPAIFRQERCGLNGRRFMLYKFRTMVLDAELQKEALAHLNVKETAFKIPNDPRVTRVGRWLRKFSVDELPQLWNVLRGEMSLVGPRPAVPEEVERYARWQRRRLRMRPGLTCIWAFAGRDNLTFDEWMRLDLQYIDSWSLRLDTSIILRTIPHVLLGKGAN